ncbi:MAG: M56 family metallopeptidase [Planctomycetaceae bacterium]
MFDLSIDWLTMIVNASFRALLIAAVAYAALKLLKLRDSNIRHRIWSGVLVGMLGLPVLSGFLPPIPLPFEIDTGWLAQAELSHASSNAEVSSSTPDVTALGEDTFGNDPFSNGSDADFNQQLPRRIAAEADQVSGERPTVEATSGIAESQPMDLPPPLTSEALSRVPFVSFVRMMLPIAFGAWVLGVLLLVVQTATGLFVTSQLLRRSESLQNQRLSDCSAAVLNVFRDGNARLMSSDEVRVPVTVGWWKPTVLLPASWRDWSTSKLEAVLAHEVTHVARRDFVVAVLAEVNRCMYWFHPMSWWLRRTLSDLAEEACDDAAIGLTGNPAGYARHLLEVAAALTHGRGRLVHPGLSMARESNVESRIATILDFTRPLSRQLTWKTLAVLLLVTVPVIALSAALQPVGPIADDQTVAAEPVEEQTTVDDAPEQEATPHELHLHGQVVGENQQAIPKARVRLFHSVSSGFYAGDITSGLIEELQVDQDGRFDTSIPLDRLPQDMAAKHWLERDWIVLVIMAPGYACETHTFQNYDEAEAIDVRLKPDVPIVGTLLSLEGQPVAGVTVRVNSVLRADSEQVDEWLARVKKNPPLQEPESGMMIGSGPREDWFPQGRDLRLSGEAAPIVTTDENGRFQLSGFGPDDLVIVNFSGGGIARSTVHLLGRDTKTVYGGHRSNLSRVGAYYGRTFTFVTQPSAPVFGVVRDLESRQPLANVTVAVGHVAGRTFSHTGYIFTSTDDQGRYRIEGLPVVRKGAGWRNRNSLSVRPGRLPYIENDGISIPGQEGLEPVEFDIELRKAVIAKGRLTDKRTGEPIRATIFYSPFRTNDNVAHYSRFADDTTTMLGNDSRYKTDDDGNFSIPVIPGRGVIAAKAADGGAYCTQYGVSEIPEFADGKIRNGQPITSDHIVPSLYHSLKAVDVPADVDEIRVDMQADSGLSLTAKFIGPDGDPLTNVEVSGAPGYRGWIKTETDSTKISSLVVGQVRPIWATLDGPVRLSRMIQLIPEEGQTEVTIQLFDRTVVTGRLIDVDGNPMANQSLEARHSNDPDFINIFQEKQTNDADGQFRFDLVVGTKYTIIGRATKFFTVLKDLDVSKPQRIDLGDLVVDPDAVDWAMVDAKQEPIVTERELDKTPTDE